jgi:hypothetical protein
MLMRTIKINSLWVFINGDLNENCFVWGFESEFSNYEGVV